VTSALRARASGPAEGFLKDLEILEGLNGHSPAWVGALRQRAADRVATLGFPTPKLEDWHFTSVAPIAESGFRTLLSPAGDVRIEDLDPFLFGKPEWPRFVFMNGRFAPELSSTTAPPRGIEVTPLAAALRTDAALGGVLGSITSDEERFFTALNTSLMSDGAVIRIAPETVAAEPIHLVFVTDGNAQKTVLHPRNLIIAGRHSEARVIESYVGTGYTGYFTNAVTECVLEAGARLEHYKVQRESTRAFHIGTMEARQARDSRLFSFSYATGAALSRTNIYTALAGENAEAVLNGLYVLDGEQHCDHQTRIEHIAPNCPSHEIYKGILDGSSHGVFNGKVYVHPEAQKTDGKQTNNNLLLSDKARIDTKPQLEIFADDVKCTHGATIGRLDELALFYMRSRGVPEVSAKRLLTYAFAAGVLETIALEPVRDVLEELLRGRFVLEVEAEEPAA